MKIKESEKVGINGHVIVITRSTKYTYIATNDKGEKVASDKSKPKLVVRVSDLLPLAEPEKKKRVSIKSVVLECIISGITDEDITKKINDDFPKSKFNKKHMAWYRSTAARDGVISHEFAPKHGKLYKTWKAEQ